MTQHVDEGVLLSVKDISLSWEGEPVICQVSFEVKRGQCVCLIGRSGSGKTTLFHALAGLTVPDSGSIELLGQDITGRPGHVSYMLQKDLLLPEKTIVDNVALPLLIKKIPKTKARTIAASKFAEFGLEGTEDKYPVQLSGGMRQRAALLRTSLMESDVILLDEPFSALDALTRADMQQWFLSMMGKMSTSAVLITHDVDEALMLADRILVLGGASTPRHLPSTILAAFDVEVPKQQRKDFLLENNALTLKREILRYL